MRIALTRGVSPAITHCELQHLDRVPIDFATAVEQHRTYERTLEACGLHLISLPPEPEFPDGLFIEDPAIVLDEIAIVCRMGASSRRRETESVAAALAPFRTLEWIGEPATIEGGDMMRIGKTLYVGISTRTNREGARQLMEIAARFGYTTVPVAVSGCLHLKSAISSISDDNVLANPGCIDMRPFRDLKILEVPAGEPAAANVLRIGGTILISSSFPRTREMLDRACFHTIALDMSELQKAEAGMTCSSLIFDSV